MKKIQKEKMEMKVFNAFIKDVLESKATTCKKEIIFDYKELIGKGDSSILLEFDAVASDGFEEYVGPVIFDFRPQGKISEQALTTFGKRIKNDERYNNATVIYIVNGKTDIQVDSEKILIWDELVVDNWVQEYAIEYFNASNMKLENEPYKIIDSKEKSFPKSEQDFEEKNKNYIERLCSIIKKGESFGIVLGAGVSIEQGAKSWDDLLTEMKREVKNAGLSDDPDKLSKNVGGSSLTTAQLCRDIYKDQTDYLWKVHESLYPHRKFSLDVKSELAAVARLSDRCKSLRHFRVLTYNFDDYLERYLNNQVIKYALLESQKDEYYKGKSKSETYELTGTVTNEFCVYHVHGFLPQSPNKSSLRGSVCLTEADYNLLYNQPYSWPITSQMSFFRENICLFVGCSLVDPNIRRLLELAKIQDHWHYAILVKDGLSIKDLAQATAHFYRLGVRIIWINNFGEIPIVLDLIK